MNLAPYFWSFLFFVWLLPTLTMTHLCIMLNMYWTPLLV